MNLSLGDGSAPARPGGELVGRGPEEVRLPVLLTVTVAVTMAVTMAVTVTSAAHTEGQSPGTYFCPDTSLSCF